MNKTLIKGIICEHGHPYDTGPCMDYPPGHPSLKYHLEDENFFNFIESEKIYYSLFIGIFSLENFL